MAISFTAQRRRNQSAALRRLMAEQRTMAQSIGRLLQSSASERDGAGQAVIPNRQAKRDALKLAIWLLFLKPYYWGRADDPLRGSDPQSPYARTLYAGVAGAVETETNRQAAMVRRLATDDVVANWLLSPYQPRTQEMSLSSFSSWIDPRGFRLTDRIVSMAIDVRSRVNRFLDYHIGRGTPAATMATRVEAFLTTGEPGRTPYGNQGAYPAQRLLEHEVVKAGGDAIVAAGAINPYVRGAQWLLDPSHVGTDQCDINASGGEDGDGIYPLSELPEYPDHINCKCGLRSVSVRNPAAVTVALRAEIDASTPAASALRGALNPERVKAEVLSGAAQQTVDRVEAAPVTLPVAPKPTPTEVKISGDVAALDGARLTQEKIAQLFDIGPSVRAEVTIRDRVSQIEINGKWLDLKTGEEIGEAIRTLFPGEKKAHLDVLAFEQKYIGNGMGMKVARNWFDALYGAGYEKAELYAGLSVGRYAWAKEGARYLDPNQAEEATKLFRQWAVKHGIIDLADNEFPIFKNALDVATYRHPRGFTLLGKDIANNNVPADMVLPLGKAFMLDSIPPGHGSWDAVIDLAERARRLAAITEMSDASIAELKAGQFVYIDSRNSGLSDSLFWKKYLVDDDSNVAPLVL